MTPIKLFLVQFVLIALIYVLETPYKPDDYFKGFLKTIGGVLVISIFATLIWAIFYYL